MRRSRKLLFSGTAILVLGLFLLAYCQDDHEPAHGPDGQVVQFEPRTLYPGASFVIPFDARDGIAGEAERGAVVLYRDDASFLFVAPLEAGSDDYRLVDTAAGTTLAHGSVTVSMPVAAELTLTSFDDASITARYGSVSIEAALDGDTATATYRSEDGQLSIETRISPRGRGELVLQGLALDGYGELAPGEAAALHDLATSPLARAVTMAPLDLGCLEGAENLPDQLHAALLQPWQMILKYQIADRFPVVRHFMEQSVCSFPDSPLPERDRPPNHRVHWNEDHAVPSTHLYFPFDGDGQMEPIAP